MAGRCRMRAVKWACSVRSCDASEDDRAFDRSVVSVLPCHGSLTECPACQRGYMIIIEVLKPAKPCRPIYDTS